MIRRGQDLDRDLPAQVAVGRRVHRPAGTYAKGRSKFVTTINGCASRQFGKIHSANDTVILMRALGISVQPGTSPKIHVVLAELTHHSASVLETFSLQTAPADPRTQVVQLARSLQGRLPGLAVQAAAIRTAAPAPVARRNKASFQRAHAEGAILFVLHEAEGIQRVEAQDANGLAKISGRSKADLETISDGLGPNKFGDAIYAVLALVPEPL